MVLVDFQKVLSNALVLLLKLNNLSKLRRIFRAYIFKFLENRLLIILGQVNDTLLGPFTRMHPEYFLTSHHLVLNHRFPYQLSVPLKSPSLQYDREIFIFLHNYVEDVASDSLTVHI